MGKMLTNGDHRDGEKMEMKRGIRLISSLVFGYGWRGNNIAVLELIKVHLTVIIPPVII